jgi:RNA polymerase sigma-70 factor (ECF subfamily)
LAHLTIKEVVTNAMVLTTPTSGIPAIDIESQLVARAVEGDESAFEKLYRRHVSRIHSLVWRMTDADTADEVTQDVFVRAWDKLASFKGKSAFGTWLYRLAVNVVLSRRRKQRSERNYLIGDDAPLELASTRSTVALVMDLEEAISRLPEGGRQIFILHDVEGWTHEEIGEQLGLATGTSKSQLSRARAALRRMLDGY